MSPTSYRNRRAFQIENEALRVTVLAEGGHVAEILHKASGVNPLWTPPWPSIEPSSYDAAKHPEYGADAESKLLAGIMGHNLCLDIFGGVSEEEAAAGLTVHGEASVARYEFEGSAMRATFPQSQLRFERRIALEGPTVRFFETVENLSACDRPVGWTQHVTLGPPFLTKGETVFELTAGRSKVFEGDFGKGGYMPPGAEFDWPHAPRLGGGTVDLRTFTNLPVSAAFTTHLMTPGDAHFTARTGGVTFGYRWKSADFPWCGIWEENHARTTPPWNGKTLTRGMEFGVSPMPETRRQMIARGSLLGVPGFRWIPARSKVSVEYDAFFA
jgi:hypothetical protein